MIDQLIIGDKASFDDFGASLAARFISQPRKKSIKETVPFSNVSYDFSAINGEVYWEDREIEYAFEMIADTPEKLEDMKIALSNWLMNVFNEEIHDPFIPDYHFVGSFEEMDYSDEEDIEKTTATVRFSVYPFKVANYPKGAEVSIPQNSRQTITIANNSSHRVTPTIVTDQNITIVLGGASFSVSAGTVKDGRLMLAVGENSLTISNSSGVACNVTISFNEEVF